MRTFKTIVTAKESFGETARSEVEMAVEAAWASMTSLLMSLRNVHDIVCTKDEQTETGPATRQIEIEIIVKDHVVPQGINYEG